MDSRDVTTISRGRVVAALALGAMLAWAPAAAADWEPAVPVDGSGPGFLHSVAPNDVATGGNGQTTILLFQKVQGGPFLASPFMVRRGPDPSSYSAPRPLTAPDKSASPEPSLAADAGGDAVGVFQWNAPARTYGVAWSGDAADPASAAVAVCRAGTPPTCPATPARVAIDDSGRAYAVAGMSTSADAPVLLSRFDPAAGTWSDAEEVSATARQPVVAANARGDLVVLYVRDVQNSFMQSEPQVFARRRLAGEPGLGPERQLSVAGDGVNGGYDGGIDGAGNVTAVFAQDPQRPGLAARIYARRWKASKASPEPAPELVSSSSPVAPGAAGPKLAVDPTGDVSVAWSESLPSVSILANERTAAGDRWLAPQTVSAAAAGFGLDLAVDYEGTATLVLAGGSAVDAFRRPTGGAWGARAPLRRATGGAVTPAAVRVSAARARQADVTFLQKATTDADALDRLFATRFTGPPPAGGGAVVAAAEGCPAANNAVSGTEGNDTLSGTDGADNVFGRGGADVLGGRGGPDCVHAGTGDDRVSGDSGDDAMLGEDGADTIYGGGGNDFLDGGAGGDLLDGGAGIDLLLGGDGADRLVGGEGDDQLDGQAGDDRLLGGPGRDALRGGDGNDLLGGADGDDDLAGGAGADRIFGLRGNDRIDGGDGTDVLSGGDGSDRIGGGAGADRIYAGAGADRIDGGAGADRIVTGAGRDVVAAGAGNDLVNVRGGGVDRVDCGRGRDTVVVDLTDKVRGCERVLRPRPRPKRRDVALFSPGPRTAR
jgi:Ca2+-binding RTX toxin-like protein